MIHTTDKRASTTMVMMVFDETMWVEVEACLRACQVQGYTLMPGSQGQGLRGGPRLNSAVWPGCNQTLLAAIDDDEVRDRLLASLSRLRASRETATIRAWTWAAENAV